MDTSEQEEVNYITAFVSVLVKCKAPELDQFHITWSEIIPRENVVLVLSLVIPKIFS